MTDATRLLTGLEAYIATLERHFVVLRDQHRDLQTVWIPTRETYRGEGAEVFAQAFQRADAQFRQYIERGQFIIGLLRGRLEALRRFDHAGDGGL